MKRNNGTKQRTNLSQPQSSQTQPKRKRSPQSHSHHSQQQANQNHQKPNIHSHTTTNTAQNSKQIRPHPTPRVKTIKSHTNQKRTINQNQATRTQIPLRPHQATNLPSLQRLSLPKPTLPHTPRTNAKTLLPLPRPQHRRNRKANTTLNTKHTHNSSRNQHTRNIIKRPQISHQTTPLPTFRKPTKQRKRKRLDQNKIHP